MRFLYSPDYNLNLGAHVFPAIKYRLIREALPETIEAIEPEPATLDDLHLVHDRAWVAKFQSGGLTAEEVLRLEIPYSPEAARAVWLHSGGSIQAARLAIANGLAFNLGGGFHHAFPAHGEGFCAINDIAVAIRAAQRDALIQSAMVVDVDVHHGNGTAAIFRGDPTVFTLSIHQQNNYPAEKPPSDLDIGLDDGCGDDQYLDRLESALLPALDAFKPGLIFYVAGADPYREDQLGGLALTIEGLRRRDEFVLREARRRKIPVAIVLAGGYARQVADTVRIQANTAIAALSIERELQ